MNHVPHTASSTEFFSSLLREKLGALHRAALLVGITDNPNQGGVLTRRDLSKPALPHEGPEHDPDPRTSRPVPASRGRARPRASRGYCEAEEEVAERFAAFEATGDLPPGWNARALAGYVMTVATGLAVQAKSATRQELTDVVEMAMKVWPGSHP